MEGYLSSHYPNLFLRKTESSLGRILCTRTAVEAYVTILTEPPLLSGCTKCSESEECSLCSHCECLCVCSAAAKKQQSASLTATLYLRRALYEIIPSLVEESDDETSDVIQVQSIKMFIKYILLSCNADEQDLRCVEDLYYDSSHSKDTSLKEMSEKLYSHLPPQLKQKFPVSLITELLSRFKANNFSFDDDGHCAVLCPIVSMVNHSCNPNSIINVYHGRLHLRSLCKIEPSQPITVAYIGAGRGAIHMPYFHRQLLMQKRWSFKCCCNRCNAAYDSARVFSCCECDEGYVFASRDDPCPGDPEKQEGKMATKPKPATSEAPPVTPPDSEVVVLPWKCLRCKCVIPKKVRHAFLSAEQDVYRLLHKNGNTSSTEEEPEGMSPLLHTAHYLATEVLMAQLGYEQSEGTDASQVTALLSLMLQNEQLLFSHPTLNTISYHRQLAEIYARGGDTDRALAEHEAAYDEICKLKGEDSPDVQSVQQFMESFLMTYHPRGETAAQLCGSWANNRKVRQDSQVVGSHN